jgi:hypothetical protein
MTITGPGCVVLKLTDFTLNNKDTLTLQGTAGTAFIINVSNHFSLTDQAITLCAGNAIEFRSRSVQVRSCRDKTFVAQKPKRLTPLSSRAS